MPGSRFQPCEERIPALADRQNWCPQCADKRFFRARRGSVRLMTVVALGAVALLATIVVASWLVSRNEDQVIPVVFAIMVALTIR